MVSTINLAHGAFEKRSPENEDLLGLQTVSGEQGWKWTQNFHRSCLSRFVYPKVSVLCSNC